MRRAALFAVCCIGSCAQPSEQDRTIETAKHEVASKLKDPSSAQFSDVRVAKGGAVCGSVNGKNSFGAYAGAEPFVYLGVGTGNIKMGEFGTFLASVERGRPSDDGWKKIDFYQVYEKYGC